MNGNSEAERETTFFPFDIYQRYRLIADLVILTGNHFDRGAVSVLDAGGYPGHLGRFLETGKVTYCDLVDGVIPDARYVRGSADALPFADASFDVVTCCDVLEHVPPDRRRKVLDELMRVARLAVVMAGPFDEPGVADAERTVDAFYRSLQHEAHPWLAEHLEQGLPSLAEVTSWAEGRGCPFRALPNGYLHHWIFMMFANHLTLTMPGFPEMYRHFNKYYNLYFYPESNREPAYRQVIYLLKSPGEMPSPMPAVHPARGDEGRDIHDIYRLLQMFFRCISDRAQGHDIYSRETAHKLEGALSLLDQLEKSLAALQARPGSGTEPPLSKTGEEAGTARGNRPGGNGAEDRLAALDAILTEQHRLIKSLREKEKRYEEALADHRKAMALARDELAGQGSRIGRMEETYEELKAETDRWRLLAEERGRVLETVEQSRAFRLARSLSRGLATLLPKR